jgi:hypothetical protein
MNEVGYLFLLLLEAFAAAAGPRITPKMPNVTSETHRK